MKEDSKSAGRWQTSVGGEYFAAGVGTIVTVVVNLFIIEIRSGTGRETAFDHAYEWYTSPATTSSEVVRSSW